MHEVDLPEVYARYFEMRQEGSTMAEIAAELGIEPGAMEAFVELAHAKLGHLER